MSPFTINSPVPLGLASECKKAARILNSFIAPGHGIDKVIPHSILANAKGLAIFTVLKAGFLFSGRAGSGLVIARLPDGSWSAPSAIMTGGMGFGGQIGAELTDVVMVLNTTAAVKTFMHHGSITLGGNISVAAGPVGRNAEASGTASYKNVAAVYSYSKTRGLFAGVSLEGSVIIERFDANAKMYRRKVKARDLLNGNVPPPPEAGALYQALDLRFRNSSSAGGRFDFMQNGNGFDDSYRRSPPQSFADSPYASSDPFDGHSPTTTRARQQSFSRAAVRQQATGGGGTFWHSRAEPEPMFDSWTASPTRSRALSSPKMNDFNDSNNQRAVSTSDSLPRARALFRFAGEQDGDLPFGKGDIITILKKTDTQQDWWTGRIGVREGMFPANFVELI
ncbi:uncharacterized protein BYT42DRAFT_543236 [Radiomyces spectabilis]|uniref:uncharacterized protein n=1 Tax=Radiomyces spectabilis TaxID=64574 RepID=UPI00221FE5D5|nr:uncharacterized protein BYT42DRAFT_543236 [Radiomyces spectabilis]KAI8391732.1 hypothetical protein BYT42DRAFT_543236 [Radiomyces spectabilis]